MATTSTDSADIKEVVQNSYDKIAPAYLEWSLSRPSPRLEYLRHLADNLPSQSIVLELGCGHGAPVTETLCKHDNVSKIVANDISEAQIKLAQQRCERWNDKVDFRLGDMMKLDFHERTLDGVVAFFSIFHLPCEEQKEMIAKSFAWLKPGGLLVCNFAAGYKISTPDTKDHTEERMQRWNFFEADMFWSGLGTEGSKEMLTDAGFEILVADVRNASEDLDATTEVHASDPDRDVEFLWMVAKKPEKRT